MRIGATAEMPSASMNRMCGRFTYTYSWAEIEGMLREFLGPVRAPALENTEQPHPARYNIAPTQPVIAIWQAEGLFKAGFMRWGLVPSWVKDPQKFPLILNARVETIREKPAFRGGLRHHRCLVPANGYYEWQAGPGKAKQPHHVTRRDDKPEFFAATWATWMGPQGEEIDTLAIITTPASPDMAFLHDRMPAILDLEQARAWLDVQNVSEHEAFAMLRPRPGLLCATPVSTRVNAVANDGPDLITPIDPDAQSSAARDKRPAGRQLNLF